MRDKTPAADSAADQPVVSSDDDTIIDTDATPNLASDDTLSTAGASRGLKIALIGALAIIVALGVFVAFLMMRAPEATSQTSSQSATDPVVVEETTLPSTPSESEQAPPEEPAAPAPAKPAPVKPAPPAKQPITEGIKSFHADLWGGGTIASACAALQGEAASQQDAVLLTFTWSSTGLINGGELQVNNTYGGSSDLQGIPATGSLEFEMDCFNLDGSIKTTSYQLWLSNGTKRYGAELVVNSNGIVTGMRLL